MEEAILVLRKISDRLDEIKDRELMSPNEIIDAISFAIWDIANQLERLED